MGEWLEAASGEIQARNSHCECGQTLEQTHQGSHWRLKPVSVQIMLRKLSYLYGLTFRYTFVKSGVLLFDFMSPLIS